MFLASHTGERQDALFPLYFDATWALPLRSRIHHGCVRFRKDTSSCTRSGDAHVGHGIRLAFVLEGGRGAPWLSEFSTKEKHLNHARWSHEDAVSSTRTNRNSHFNQRLVPYGLISCRTGFCEMLRGPCERWLGTRLNTSTTCCYKAMLGTTGLTTSIK